MKKLSTSRGFTLIELLIVIAVIGILAAVTLVSIDPLEQIERGQDAGRKTAIGQLGRALQAYYTGHNATYPAASDTWIASLITAGELKSAPTNPDGAQCAAASFEENGFCYATSGTGTTADAIAYTKLLSKSDKTNCGATEVTWFVYSTMNGGAGRVCTAAAAEPGVQNFNFK